MMRFNHHSKGAHLGLAGVFLSGPMFAGIALTGQVWIAGICALLAAFAVGNLVELSQGKWGWGTYAAKDIWVTTAAGPVLWLWTLLWLWLAGWPV